MDKELQRRDQPDKPTALTWLFGLDKPDLISYRQPLGVMPTLRFWNRLDTFKYQAPFLLLGIVLGSGLAVAVQPWLIGALGPLLGLLVMLPALVLAGLLPLGLFERWLRRHMASQKELPPAG